VIVDGYAFCDAWLEGLRGDDRLVAYIDDLARERLTCDAVVNPNVSGPREQYHVGPATLLLCGPAYALVHDGFVRARARVQDHPVRDHIERLLVVMGGSDPNGVTLDAIASLTHLDIDHTIEVRIVVGAANRRLEVIHTAAARYQGRHA